MSIEEAPGTVTDKKVSIKSFCMAGSGEEKLVFYIELKIKYRRPLLDLRLFHKYFHNISLSFNLGNDRHNILYSPHTLYTFQLFLPHYTLNILSLSLFSPPIYSYFFLWLYYMIEMWRTYEEDKNVLWRKYLIVHQEKTFRF